MRRRIRRTTAQDYLGVLDPEKVAELYRELGQKLDNRGDIVVAGHLTKEAQERSSVIIGEGSLRCWRSRVGLVNFSKGKKKKAFPMLRHTSNKEETSGSGNQTHIQFG